jgi:aminoglycoside 3-N-acetyltransferase
MWGRSKVTADDVTKGLRDLGVEAGGVILVHSSLSSFGHVKGGADAVIDGLLEAVGTDGTLVLPTHTWDRIDARNPVFDASKTPSCVGTIPETFWRERRCLRGLHPTHSCAAAGPLAEEMLAGHETQVTPCGGRSPYQRIMRRGGKIVFLGVNLRVNTTFHALEEMAVVPWLFGRFEMLYTIGRDGRRIEVPSRRHAEPMQRDFPKMEPLLAEEGALRTGGIGNATVRAIDAARMERVMMPMLAKDPFLTLAPGPARRERTRWERRSQ